ncbi:hypothetical protein [Synechococcus sp. M16CYN]
MHKLLLFLERLINSSRPSCFVVRCDDRWWTIYPPRLLGLCQIRLYY